MAHAKKIKEDQRRSANYCAVIRSTLEYNLTQKQSDDQRRRKQSRVGGGGAASRKRASYFTLANKQKGLTLKNSLSLLNLYD